MKWQLVIAIASPRFFLLLEMDGSGPASNDRSSRLLRTKNGIKTTSPSRSAQCGSTSQKENPARRLLRSNRRFSSAAVPKTAAQPPIDAYPSCRCSDVPRYPPNERPQPRPAIDSDPHLTLLFAFCVRSWMRTLCFLDESYGPDRLILRQREIN